MVWYILRLKNQPGWFRWWRCASTLVLGVLLLVTPNYTSPRLTVKLTKNNSRQASTSLFYYKTDPLGWKPVVCRPTLKIYQICRSRAQSRDFHHVFSVRVFSEGRIAWISNSHKGAIFWLALFHLSIPSVHLPRAKSQMENLANIHMAYSCFLPDLNFTIFGSFLLKVPLRGLLHWSEFQ